MRKTNMTTSKEQLFQQKFKRLLEKLQCSRWLDSATKLGANPIFFGYDLIKYFNGDDSSIYLALVSMEFTGDLQYDSKILDNLPSTGNFNKELAEYSLGSITLNIWESYKQSELTQVTNFEKVFFQDSTTLRTAVLYYNNGEGSLRHLSIKNHHSFMDIYKVPLPLCRYKGSGSALNWLIISHTSNHGGQRATLQEEDAATRTSP